MQVAADVGNGGPMSPLLVMAAVEVKWQRRGVQTNLHIMSICIYALFIYIVCMHSFCRNQTCFICFYSIFLFQTKVLERIGQVRSRQMRSDPKFGNVGAQLMHE
jgi:hypothetical protein